MAKLEQLVNLSRQERQYRYFSEDFKRKKVLEIEKGLTSVGEIKRQYQVSGTAIYRWIYKYSMSREKGERTVIESKSDTLKIRALKEQVEHLERLVGQKQIKIDFLEKMIEIAGEECGIDIKKKHSTPRSSASGKAGKNAPIK